VAVAVLGKAGLHARAARGELLAVAEDENEAARTRCRAEELLWRVCRDTRALAVLRSLLKDKEQRARGEAAETLADLGDAERALPAMHQAMYDKNDPDRAEMALVYWRIAEPQEAGGVRFDPRQEALSVLIQMLRDQPVPEVRYAVAEALGQIGAEAKPAVPLLVRLLEKGDPVDEDRALRALAEIGPAAREAVPALLATIKEDEEADQEVGTLLQIEPRPEAVARLERGETVFRWLWSSNRFGPQSRALVPALLRLLRHDDHAVYLEAGRILRQIDRQTADKMGVP
jgi:hypothetical protein